jgi:hypothetical protein
MRRVLIISPHFPPTNAPDHQRVRMSLPYFRENGWEAVVLAVDAAAVAAPQDPLLATTVPADITVHRVGALPASVTRFAGLGNLAYRAWFQLKSRGDRLLREEKFDLVYFSTTQFVATALGRRWLRKFGVPFVVDIQDPWRTDYYERPGAPTPPGGWKYRFARAQAARLEERSWRDAAGFVSVSEDYLAQLRARYPWFDTKPAAFIPFGAPEADFELARAHREWVPAFVREPGAVHLVSVGAVGPIMRTALECLFAGLRNYRAVAPTDAAWLRLHFIGTSYAGRRAEPSVLPVALACGVADLVREETGRVGYFTAISTLLAADGVIIPGSDDTAYNPSKIAASFLAAKPTLALTPAGSAMDRMVSELGFATVARWPAPDGVTSVTEFFRQQVAQPRTAPEPTPNQVLFAATHTARVRTRQQCALFDQALASCK